MGAKQIILVGKSRGAVNGDQRAAEEDTAAELVRAGLAKYAPPKAAKKAASAD